MPPFVRLSQTVSARLRSSDATPVAIWLLLSALVAFVPFNIRRADLAPNLDATGAVLMVVALSWRERRPHWGLFALLGLALTVVRVHRTANELFQLHLGRRMFFYPDYQLLPNTADYLLQAEGALGALKIALVGVLPLGVLAANMWLLRQMWLTTQRPRPRLILLSAITLAGLSLMFTKPTRSRWGAFTNSFVPPLVEDVQRWVNASKLERGFERELLAKQAQRQAEPHDLARLSGHFLIVFVESYGAAVFENPKLARKLAVPLQHFASTLQAAGFQLATRYYTSPVTGGGSWLAHATVATGVKIDNQVKDQLLMRSTLTSLPYFFAAAGYRTANVMSGIEAKWPEGKFYGYDEAYFREQIPYHGPDFVWSHVPDQFLLEFAGQTLLRGSQRPVFAQIVGTSSHSPWQRLPPYREQWDGLLESDFYQAIAPIPLRDGDLNDPSAQPAFAETIQYCLRSVGDFVRRYSDSKMTLLVLGDHQPVVSVTGANASWAVPVHFISNNANYIDMAVRQGFTRGAYPQQDSSPLGLEDLAPFILHAFSTPNRDQAEPVKAHLQ